MCRSVRTALSHYPNRFRNGTLDVSAVNIFIRLINRIMLGNLLQGLRKRSGNERHLFPKLPAELSTSIKWSTVAFLIRGRRELAEMQEQRRFPAPFVTCNSCGNCHVAHGGATKDTWLLDVVVSPMCRTE